MAENTDNPGAALPEKIGPWRVVRLIGRGGMAEVFEVADARLGARYALKLFTYARGQEAAARERFATEGRLLAKLDHPRLVRVYDVGEDAAGRPYFVMDLVLDPEGRPRTLADAGAEGVDEERVAMWYEDLREGLAYIHGRGILHRDLKLQNVLVGPDGHVVLSDFGVAKIADPGLRADIGLSAEQTLIAVKGGQRTVMGSVGYMAPEVEMGVAASKESDWYALGVLVFHLLTGVWCDARTDVVGDLETYNPAWREILPKLLHANPAGRTCPSWDALVRARREEEAFESERRLDVAGGKLRRLKLERKLLVGFAIVALFALMACVGRLMSRSGVAPQGEEFEDYYALVDDGPVVDAGPFSEQDLLAARIDVWVLMAPDFVALRAGGASPRDLAKRSLALGRAAKAGKLDFARESALEAYRAQGRPDVVAYLLFRGAARLYRRVGMEVSEKGAADAAQAVLKGMGKGAK